MLVQTAAWKVGGFQPDSFLFTWDALARRDRLVYGMIRDTVTFGYDKDGALRIVREMQRRLRRAVPRAVRVHRQPEHVPLFNLAFDGDNTLRATGFMDWRYVRGPGIDDPLATTRST
jgi:hypothetical protein